jgi:hypothetical protein
VGFSGKQTEIVEEVMADGMTFTTVNQRLAPVFVSSNVRTHALFIRMKLPIPDHTAKPNPDATKEARESLKLFMDTMVQIDPTTILYRWQQTNPEEKDACVRSTHLPTTITGLQAFMNGFRPRPEGGAMWGSMRIGFNGDEADFFINLQEEGRMHDFWSKKTPLQTADTECCGFLYLSLESMDPEPFAALTNEWIKQQATQRKKTPITIAYEWRSIWDDGPKVKDLSQKQRRAKKALHIVCAKGFSDSAQMWIRAFIQSETYSQYCNIPMRFIPQFKRGQGETYNSKHEQSVQKHMKITAFGVKTSTTIDLRNIDSPCDLLPGSPTGRQLILGLKLRPPSTTTPPTANPPNTTPPASASRSSRRSRPPGRPKKTSTGPLPVFLSIDRSQRRGERGTYVVTYTQSNAVEAEEKLRYLLTYLEHEHGDSSVSHWFTQDACDRAEDVLWDKATNRPISKEEIALDDLLNDDIDWIDDLDAQFENAKVTIDIPRPNRFNKVQSNPLEGDAESIQTFYKTSDLPDDDGDNGDAPPTIGSSSRAEGSHESSAPLVV